tara:strand:+ start:289 stop:477 length:189 start_codon:yes stop_codon:yes gene_type:complete
MNINDPVISRELATLMNELHLNPLKGAQFRRAAFKAKDIESFKKDLRSGVIYEEPIPNPYLI